MIEETQQEAGQAQRKVGNGRSRPGNGSKGGFWGWLLSLFGRSRRSGEDSAPTFVDEEGQAQSLEEDETQMVRSILELDKTLAREIMVPRIDIVALGCHILGHRAGANGDRRRRQPDPDL